MKYLITILCAVFIMVGCSSVDEIQMEEYPLVKGYDLPTESEILSVPLVDTTELFDERIALSPTFSLEMPPIKYQGSEGSCGSFASAYAARSYHLARNTNDYSYTDDELLSPEFVFNHVKSDAAECSGSKLRDNLLFMKTIGVSTWKEVPYSSTNGCSTLNFSDEAIAIAECYKIDDFRRIGSTAVALLKRLLVNGHPIIFGTELDNSLFVSNINPPNNPNPDWDPNFIWNDKVGGNSGGHALVIVGWDDTKNAWKIMNSWSTYWGDNGFGWIDYDFLNEVVHGPSLFGAGILDMYVMETKAPNPSCGGCDGTTTVTDIEGNVYNVVKIGDQCWMQENLKTSKYNDGTSIPTGLSNDAWENTNSGAYAIYDNNAANNTTYGKLYNWYAVNTGKLCPEGWHIPSDAEWTVLINFLGGEEVAGGKMKSITGWQAPNTGATNSSGFTGLPGGSRFNFGSYSYIGHYGYWWSSTEYDTYNAWYRYLFKGVGDASRFSYPNQNGFSCRCLRD